MNDKFVNESLRDRRATLANFAVKGCYGKSS